jgi:hypothetical protein
MEFRETPTRFRSNLLQQSIDLCIYWISREWESRVSKPKLPVSFDIVLDAERAVFKDSNTPSGSRTPLPYVSLILNLIRERPAPFNPWLTNHLGIPIGYSKGKEEQYRAKVKPVDLGFGVRFRTSNMEEALAFSSMWVERQPNVLIDVRNKQTGAVFRVNMDLGTEVSIPNANTGTPGDFIDIETTLVCRTFSGEVDMKSTIKAIKIGLTGDPNELQSLSVLEVSINGVNRSGQ